MPRSEPQKEAATFARLAPLLPDLPDTLALVGLALLVAGIWMIYVPAAFIALGVVLLGLGLFGATRGAKTWES